MELKSKQNDANFKLSELETSEFKANLELRKEE